MPDDSKVQQAARFLYEEDRAQRPFEPIACTSLPTPRRARRSKLGKQPCWTTSRLRPPGVRTPPDFSTRARSEITIDAVLHSPTRAHNWCCSAQESLRMMQGAGVAMGAMWPPET